MNSMRKVVGCLTLAAVVALTGCQGGGTPQNGGFHITVAQRFQSANGKWSPPQYVPAVPISGGWNHDDPSELAQGTVETYGDAILGGGVPSGKLDGYLGCGRQSASLLESYIHVAILVWTSQPN